MTRFEGLIAAQFAPFHPDGRLNLAAIEPYVERLVADGLTGVFVNGSNGEGPNLTVQERIEVAAAFKAAAGHQIAVIVHVGHASIAEARKLAAHAQQIGADAISSVSAFYYKPTSVRLLVESMAEIAVAAPETPFYYYHIPGLTGVSLDMRQFLEQGRQAIPSLRGLKYTAPTLHEYQDCLTFAGDDFDVLYGTDEMLLPALAVGARGAIGSTYNFAAPIYQQVIDHFRAGRLAEAQARQALLVRMVRVLLQYPPIPAQKAIMSRLGLNLGPCRLPLPDLSEEEAERFYAQLTAIGFFEQLHLAPVVD